MSGEGAGRTTGGPGTLVGRGPELAVVQREVTAVGRGSARPLVIVGEAGIGKTRLAEEAAAAATKAGLRVAWGRCWESGVTPPYWPWIQVLDQLLAPAVADELTSRMGWGADPRSGGEENRSSAVSEDGGARFRLFHDACRALTQSARAEPALLVLEDLHVADHPSLLLADFVVSQLGGGGDLLLVATYRDVEARLAERSSMLAHLARHGSLIELRGLDADAVATVLEDVAPSTGAGRAVDVRDATGGNPLFVTELGRLMELGDTTVPDSALATLTHRVELLDPTSRAVLGAAAVAGRRFELSLIAGMAGVDVAEVRRAAGEAEELGIVAASDAGWRFAHDLFRQTVAAAMDRNHTVELHRRAAAHLRATGAPPPEVAHHAWEGASDDLAELCQDAGDHAVQALAYEEATIWYERALGSLPADDVAARLDLLDRLGTTAHRRGDFDRRRRMHVDAATLARRHGRTEALARAALGAAGYCDSRHDPERIALLQEAAGALPHVDAPLRAQVLAVLGQNLLISASFGGPDRRRQGVALIEESVAIARRLDDPGTLRTALFSQHLVEVHGDGHPEHRLLLADQAVEAALLAGDADDVVVSRCWRAHELFATGAVAAAEAELGSAAALAESVQQPFALWTTIYPQAALSLIRGRIDEAERLADEAFDHGLRTGFRDVDYVRAALRFFITRARGRLAEMTPPEAAYEGAAAFAETLSTALALAELGFPEDARRMLARLPHEGLSVPAIAMWAEAAFLADDTSHAVALYRDLEPHHDRWTSLGFVFMTTGGSLHHPLGLLAGLQGDADLACRHLDAARILHEEIGARLLLAEGDAAQGRVLLDAGRTVEAGPHLTRALDSFRAMGMPAHARRVEALRERAGSSTGARAASPSRPPAVLEAGLVRAGRDWTVCFAGRESHVRHAVGLDYLARLVSCPGSELHCLDLASPAAGGASPGPAVSRATTGPILDERAKAEYRRRVDEINAEIEEAAGYHDTGRVERLEYELEALLTELRGALGLGGRDRMTGSVPERARVSVTKALRRAIARVEEADPELGAHLQATIHTGTYCSYRPDPVVSVHWDL